MKIKFGMRGIFLLLSLFLAGESVLGLSGCAKPGAPEKVEAKKAAYTCVMHHQIRRDKPGDCPICGMTLVPVEEVEGTPAPGGASGSDSGSSAPPKTAEGRPQEIQGLAPVHLTAYKEQLIGVKYATVQRAPITRIIRTTGRFAGGAGDFAALAGDFAARKPLRSSGRYVVADVYALDLPLVRVGERAFVTALSGTGARLEGRVSLIYPYDGTQSRVTRVKISLTQVPSPEIFANVEIEAVMPPKMAVPPTAVMDTGTQRYVFVQTAPGVFSPRPITTGFEGDDLWEVTSGLKEGEKVVQGANFLIDADSKIKAAFAETK